MRVCIRDERRTGEQDWYDAGFQLDDPEKVVCTDNKKYVNNFGRFFIHMIFVNYMSV